MSNNTNSLSDDELWAKCQQGGPITPQDLGLKSTQSTSNGTNYLQFELNDKRSRR